MSVRDADGDADGRGQIGGLLLAREVAELAYLACESFVRGARDDEVDVPVLREQRGDLGARLDGLYERARERAAARERGLDRAC